MQPVSNRYSRIIEAIFFDHYQEGAVEVAFERAEILQAAQRLGVPLPKNLGDIIYSFRYRSDLPPSIVAKAKDGFQWIIRSRGRARYLFVLVPIFDITPSSILVETKIPDATP